MRLTINGTPEELPSMSSRLRSSVSVNKLRLPKPLNGSIVARASRRHVYVSHTDWLRFS